MNNVIVGQRRIYLTEIFWRTLAHWRRGVALIFVSVIAVILAGYMADRQAYNSDLAKIRAIDNAPLTKEERTAVEEAAAAYNAYSDYQKNNSSVETFAPDSVPHTTIKFYPDLDYIEFTDRQQNITTDLTVIEYMYKNYVDSDDFAANLSETLGNNELVEYFDKIITCDFSNIHINHDMIVSIYYPDAGYLDKICDEVIRLLSNKITDAAGTVGAPTMKVNERISEMGNSQKLDELKAASDSKMSVLTKKQVARFNELTGADYKYAESEKNATVYTDEKTGKKIQPVAPEIKFDFKLLIVGIIIGIAVSVLWGALGYVYASKLQDSEDMENVFGLRNIGSIYIDKKKRAKKKIFHQLDSVIYRSKTKHRKPVPTKEQIKIICQSISTVCRNEGIHSLCIISSNHGKDIARISELVIYELLKGNLEIISCFNAMCDVNELRNLTDCGNVLIIEQVGISEYSEIADEVRFVQLNSKKNIGYVNIV